MMIGHGLDPDAVFHYVLICFVVEQKQLFCLKNVSISDFFKCH
jgi:hypothetical protein